MVDSTCLINQGVRISEVPEWVKSRINDSERHKRQLLPAALREKLESYFGLQFDQVGIIPSDTPHLIGAQAFAIGESIHISPQMLDYGSPMSIRLLCHELTHIVQGRLGMAQVESITSLWDPTLECQADRIADGFGLHNHQVEWTACQLSAAARSSASRAIQCQPRGNLNANYIGGGMHPLVPAAPAGIGFSGANQLNEVWGTRALALARAKTLLGVPGNIARRTYHWYVMHVGNDHVHPHNEGLPVNGRQLVGANAAQRTGRYYDFGRGKLIVEHTDDPNSTTQIGIAAGVQRAHFHIASYDNNLGMYMPYRTGGGIALAGAAGQPGPDVYDIDRRYHFEQGDIHNGGIMLHHHIYYH